MFTPKTEKIERLSQEHSGVIQELEQLFQGSTNFYIDYANVVHWQRKLGWHIDVKRLKQFLDSFDSIQEVKFYYGTLQGHEHSDALMKQLTHRHYTVITKPVKIMRLSIDVSGIPENSPTILQNFIDRGLLAKFNLETIEYLNGKLKELNQQGITAIEHRKCNFDVEIGRNMLTDYDKNGIENFILWSGDSDFAEPVSQLLKDGKKVFIFATARRVSRELAATGAGIFDIKKIREFICSSREIKKAAP